MNISPGTSVSEQVRGTDNRPVAYQFETVWHSVTSQRRGRRLDRRPPAAPRGEAAKRAGRARVRLMSAQGGATLHRAPGEADEGMPGQRVGHHACSAAWGEAESPAARSIRARMSSTRHAVIRSPRVLTGWG